MKLFGSVRLAIERWHAIRELRSVEKTDRGNHYWELKYLIDEAKGFLERDHPIKATEIWARAHARFPDAAMKSQQALDLLLHLRLYDDAEAMLTIGQKRYPSHIHFMEGLALVAYKRGNREDALDRCHALRRKFPGSLKGYWIAAAALSELDRPEEAEALLAEGLRLVPDDIGLQMEYARLATRRQDWSEAVKRWTDIYNNFNHLAGVSGSAAALKELGRHDEADQLLYDVMYKAGNDVPFWLESASIAEHRQNWEEAARRWATVRDRFPLLPHGYIRGVRPLLELGHVIEAEYVLQEGIDRIQGDPALRLEYAQLAHRRQDWHEASQRWSAFRERFPNRPEGYQRGSEALKALGQTAEAAKLLAMAPN